MSHYYINDEKLQSEVKTITYTYKNTVLKYYVDNGVFSKNRVDFGTNTLLNSLKTMPDNSRILDVGCGYGPIGLAIAKTNKTYNIEMIDINIRAIKLAVDNKRINNINNAYIYESDLYEKVNGNFNYIISNPPIRAGKEIVFNIVSQGFEHLEYGGKIIVVIQKKQGALSLLNKMNEIYGNYTIINKEKGYYIIESEKK